MTRYLFLISLIAGVLSGLVSADAKRPNFLLIYTDDQGYGDVSTYGAKDVRTPNIDGLAAEGMLFTTMRANCTVCSPSRAARMPMTRRRPNWPGSGRWRFWGNRGAPVAKWARNC